MHLERLNGSPHLHCQHHQNNVSNERQAELYVDRRVLLRESAHEMDVVVEDDCAHHDTLAERYRLGLLKTLVHIRLCPTCCERQHVRLARHSAYRFDHDSA